MDQLSVPKRHNGNSHAKRVLSCGTIDGMRKCGSCGLELDESYNSFVQKPCPTCGSLLRIVSLSGSFSCGPPAMYTKLGWWDRAPKSQALQWGVRGDDLYRRSGRWSVVVRTFDRIRDWYFEHITDKETGQVLRHTEEKLSEHDHGSRKKR